MAGGVLFADDLSSRSEVVATTAVELAERLGLPLAVLHVVTDEDIESFRRDAPEGSGYVDLLFSQLEGRVTSQLQTVVGPDPVPDVDVRIVRGEPDAAVLDALREGTFDYGVIGVRSRSRVGKLVFGSAAQSILLLTPCPIVAVPTG